MKRLENMTNKTTSSMIQYRDFIEQQTHQMMKDKHLLQLFIQVETQMFNEVKRE